MRVSYRDRRSPWRSEDYTNEVNGGSSRKRIKPES